MFHPHIPGLVHIAFLIEKYVTNHIQYFIKLMFKCTVTFKKKILYESYKKQMKNLNSNNFSINERITINKHNQKRIKSKRDSFPYREVDIYGN